MKRIYRFRGYASKKGRIRQNFSIFRGFNSLYVYRKPIIIIVILLLFVSGAFIVWAELPKASSAKSASPGKASIVRYVKPPNGLAKPFGMALGDTLPFLSARQLNKELNTIAAMGVGWIRIDVSWADVQPQDAQHYDWSGLDRVITSANRHHIQILGILAYTPVWAAPSSCPVRSSQKCAPSSDAQFAAFASAAVQRYAPQGVHDWEIWNEPNLQGFWEPAPSPRAYTNLLKAAFMAIKSKDSKAMVVSGGLGPLDGGSKSIRQQPFLAGMYASGARPYFDALGYHPYSFPAPPSYVISWSGWSTMADISNSIRSIMSANGDGMKPIWITEYGAPTNGHGTEATPNNLNFNAMPDHVNEALQAQMLTQATESYKFTPWLGNFFWYSYKDLGISTDTTENFFGLLRYNGSYKPAYYAYRQAINGGN